MGRRHKLKQRKRAGISCQTGERRGLHIGQQTRRRCVNSLAGERHCQCSSRKGHAAAGQKPTEFFQGARYSLLRRVLTRAEPFTDDLEVMVLKITNQQRVALFFAELGHGFVEHRSDGIPIRS